MRVGALGVLFAIVQLSSAAAQAEPPSLWTFSGVGHAGRVACISPSALPAERSLSGLIDWAAVQFGVRPSFLRAIVACESNFNHAAVSRAGARGLAQIMPQTAQDLGVPADGLWDPKINLYSAAKYIRLLVARYGNNLDNVLIAYNAGPAYVETGRPPPKETVAYVARVKSAYRHYLTRPPL